MHVLVLGCAWFNRTDSFELFEDFYCLPKIREPFIGWLIREGISANSHASFTHCMQVYTGHYEYETLVTINARNSRPDET